MARKLYPDKWLFVATVGLALFGLVMVAKQAIWTGIAFALMFAAMRLDYTWLRNRRVVYGLIVLTALMLLAVFAFPTVNGAHRWIKLSKFSIQPSEISKLTLAIFLAYFLEKHAGEERSFSITFLPCGAV